MAETSGVCAIVPQGYQDGTPPRVFGMGTLVSDRELVTCAQVGRPADPRRLPVELVVEKMHVRAEQRLHHLQQIITGGELPERFAVTKDMLDVP
jgi:hypothetical protein